MGCSTEGKRLMTSTSLLTPRAQWGVFCQIVADAMRVYTRPFVTPLVADIPDKAVEFGTGSYIDSSHTRLLTCAHVANYHPL